MRLYIMVDIDPGSTLEIGAVVMSDGLPVYDDEEDWVMEVSVLRSCAVVAGTKQRIRKDCLEEAFND